MWLESRSIGKVSTTGLLKMWKLTIGRLLDVVFIIQSYAFCWIKRNGTIKNTAAWQIMTNLRRDQAHYQVRYAFFPCVPLSKQRHMIML
jgi:hypothetical protein